METERPIHIARSALLEQIKNNFEKHKVELVEAKSAYGKRMIELTKFFQNVDLDTMLTSEDPDNLLKFGLLLAKQAQKLHFISEPIDCSQQYLNLIRRFELETSDTIDMTEVEFTNWVLDKAGWRESATVRNSSYSVK